MPLLRRRKFHQLPSFSDDAMTIYYYRCFGRRKCLIFGLCAVILMVYLSKKLFAGVETDHITRPVYPRLSEYDDPLPWYPSASSHAAAAVAAALSNPPQSFVWSQTVQRKRTVASLNAPDVASADGPLPMNGNSPVDQSLENGAPSSASPKTTQVPPRSRVMRPCGEHVEHNVHYMDRKFWQSLSRKTIMEKRQSLLDYMDTVMETIDYNSFDYQGRGIVYTAGQNTIARALISIRMLRRYGCRLPIEVWYMKGELNEDALKDLEQLQVTPRDLLHEQKRFDIFSDFQVGHVYGNHRNYHIKTLVLLLTQFKELIYLDSDNMPLRDPEYLFGTPEFQQTGALFWPDFWKFPIDNPMWKITGRQCEDEWEQESGQLVLDKKKSWRALLVSLFFQQDHPFYFKILLGDKDTFRFGWKVTDTPYWMIQHPLAVAGRVRQGRFCGHTMVQHDPSGELLFMHSSALKTSHAMHLGNTWEAIQFLERVDPVILPPPSRHTLAFAVSYPVTFEYAGGAERAKEEGGTGHDTLMNPCITYGLAKNVTIETTKAAVESWGVGAVDSYRLITEDFTTYQGGKYSWFEKLFYDFGGTQSSKGEEHSLFFW